MGRVLPISILNEQEDKTDFRTGTHFSILEVVVAKMQLGKLWSQLIEWNPRTWCTNNFFRLSPNLNNSEEKQFGNNSGEISQQWYFAFARISKARNQSYSEWACSWWTCSWWNLPFQPSPADSSHLMLCLAWFSQKTEGDVQGGIMDDSVCRGMALPGCSSALFQPSLAPVGIPSSLHFWMSKEEKLEKRIWRGAWRGLGTAQLEVGQFEAGLKFLDI